MEGERMINLQESIQIDYVKCKEIIDSALQSDRKIDVSDMPKELWLQTRNVVGIGASDTSIVLGLNRYKTAFQLWKEKVSDEIEPIDNNYIRWGNLLEPPIIEEYERMTQTKTRKDTYMRIHPEFNCLYANLDGVIYSDDKLIGAAECKSTVSSVYKSWKENADECPQGIPLEHYCQVMHQFACVPELEWIDIAVLILDRREVEIKRIFPDKEYIQKQTQTLVAWYNAYVVPQVAPPMTAFEFAYSEPVLGSMIEADAKIADLVSKLKEKKALEKSIGKEVEDIENSIKEFIGESENLTYAGDILATWKQQQREIVKSKDLKAEQPDVYKKYSDITKFRVLRLK